MLALLSTSARDRANALVQADMQQEADEQEDQRLTNDRFRQRRRQVERQLNGVTTWVDEYDGPRGKGYIVRSETVEDRVTYQKADNVGPEAERSFDWQENI